MPGEVWLQPRGSGGPAEPPAPRPQGPADHQHLGASPAAAVALRPPDGCAQVKGGRAGYTLTTTPGHLPPAASSDG